MLQLQYFFIIWKLLHKPSCLLFILWYIISGSVHSYIHIYMYACIPTYLPTCLPPSLPPYLPTNLPTYLSTYLPTYLAICLSIYLPKGELKCQVVKCGKRRDRFEASFFTFSNEFKCRCSVNSRSGFSLCIQHFNGFYQMMLTTNIYKSRFRKCKYDKILSFFHFKIKFW